MVLYLLMIGFWIITSAVAYSVAGEKMPWLTVHIALPLILFTGWGLGQLVESIDWPNLLTKRGLLLISMIVICLISLSVVIGSWMGPDQPFSGKELNQLNNTLNFIFALIVTIVSGVIIGYLLKEWDNLEQPGFLIILAIRIHSFLATSENFFLSSIGLSSPNRSTRLVIPNKGLLNSWATDPTCLPSDASLSA